MAVIEFQDVKKFFKSRVGGPKNVKHILMRPFKPKAFKVREDTREVLKGVTFKIEKGEFVGIMGRNGVGKSTLLKLISRIYFPSSGKILLNGSIAPLLELGAGFADELSGYENIFLNASILGFGRKNIQEHTEKIVEFSGLGEQIHDPVRNYSSGMLIRLAFAIACHLDSEILLFDEVLAVGDLGFQEKCIRKIRELHAQGKSIVLVTHSPEQVAEYCTRCIVLNEGQLVFDGSAAGGAEIYRSLFR